MINFNKMIDVIGSKKVKFLYFEYGDRPIKCSGYIYGISKNMFLFQHLKIGRNYFGKNKLKISNIRFHIQSFQEYINYATSDELLCTFINKHIEYKNIIKNNNKFNVISES